MDRRARAITLSQWLVLGVVCGVLCGAASALFLWLLARATSYREGHEAILFALPLAGLALGLVYERFGAGIAPGTNLIVDTIHDGGPELPLRMAPMVLIGTVLTHLFGGSAGREGTAVQMGASLCDWLSHRLRLGARLRRQLLAAGVAGGFGSVFGTPIAGTLFGLEFVVLGRLEYDALLPALLAAVVGDRVTRGLQIRHLDYPAVAALPLSWITLIKWLLFAAAIAAVAAAFIELTHALKRAGRAVRLPLRMLLGGACVVALWRLCGESEFLGLSLPTLLRAFGDPALPAQTFALKLLFTALTLGAGFLGGEVTPLFVIGAALGNLLSRLLGLPLSLGAGVGMAALFAAASNAPLALSVMAVELLGAAAFPHVVIVSVTAYLLSGRRSIYPSQRLLSRKLSEPVAPPGSGPAAPRG